jgi:2-methylisocitrate lyase-like PEP mutase family enzyme
MGFEEAVKRMNAALAAGADMAFLEAPQTLEEIAAVPRLVKGPCLLNVVWGGKTPAVDFADAERMGFKLAIVPGLLFKTVIGACDAALKELRETRRHPVPIGNMTVRDAFRRVGAEEWDRLRDAYREPKTRAAE